MQLGMALDSWRHELRAGNKTPRTIETYLLAGEQLLDFLKNRGQSLDVTEIGREEIRAFIGHVLDTRAAGTAKQRHGSLSVLFKWLVSEGEIDVNPMIGVSAPRVVEKPVPVVTHRHFDLLLKTCNSTFAGRRDAALLWLLWDSGMRLSELAGLIVDDVALDMDIVWVEGKGGKIRQAPFTQATTRALDRYLRSRVKHRMAGLPQLWIGERGALTKSGIRQVVTRRSEMAGIGHVHPHMFRHSLADRWLSAGGDEGGLMDVAGWSRGSRTMLDRYGRFAATKRSLATYRRLFD
jgi:site-specific recombinase XerD